MKRGRKKARPPRPDIDETKMHILTAGRELMLAAQGALVFCRDYARASASPSSRSQLMKFFSKASQVADELAKGLVTATRIPGAAKQAAGHMFDAIGREMKEGSDEEPPARRGKGRGRRAACGAASRGRKPQGGERCRKSTRR